MDSLELESLFSDTLSEETKNTCCNSFFGSENKICNFDRTNLTNLRRTCFQNNLFNQDGNIYKQMDVVAMKLSLGSTLANLF